MKRCTKTIKATDTVSVKDIQEALKTLRKYETRDYNVHIEKVWPFISIQRVFYWRHNPDTSISDMINEAFDRPTPGKKEKK